MKDSFEEFSSQTGAVLATSLIFLAILSVLGSTAFILTRTDLRIGSNYKSSTQAFNDAQAGINFALSRIEAGLQNGSFSLPSAVGGSTTLSYTQPSGFSFSLSDITKINSNHWTLTSTGYGPNNSSTILKVVVSRDITFKYAAFGDSKLDTKNGGSTQSYDSGSSDPTENDPASAAFISTHQADVGSNDWLVTHNGAVIDGDGVFGEQDDGSATTDGLNSNTTFYGTAPKNAGRIDPDPLGVNSGGSYDPSNYADPASNDNNLADPASELNGDSISLNGDLTLYGQSGGANFYVTDVTLKNGANLTIDASSGPVNLFLTGSFDAKNGSSITVEKSGSTSYKATSFNIFSNSSDKIDLKHSSNFTGLLYAPYADINVKNSANVYGSIWGDTVDIKNGGTLYFDTAITDQYSSNSLNTTSWSDQSGY